MHKEQGSIWKSACRCRKEWKVTGTAGRKPTWQMWRGSKLEVNLSMLLFWGQANCWLGEFEVAEQQLNQAVKDKNLQGEAMLYLAFVKEKQGQGEGAGSTWSRLRNLCRVLKGTTRSCPRLLH